MERLNGRDLKALLTFSQGLIRLRSPEEFLDYTLPRLATLVSSEFSGFGEIDPSRRPGEMGKTWIRPIGLNPPGYTEWSQSIFAEEPIWIQFQRTRKTQALKHSDFYSEREYRETEQHALYNEIARPTRDAMTVIAETPSGCLHNFGTVRGKRYTERDRLVFDAIAPHIFQAYSNANDFSCISRQVAQLGGVIEKRTRAVVLLTLDRQVSYLSDRASRWMKDYFGDFVSKQLPEKIDLWMRRQLERLRIVDDVAPVAEGLRVCGPRGAIVIRLVSLSDGWFLLLEKEAQQLEIFNLRALPITKRQAEVLAYVANGKTNPEIATILGISRLTVKKHLEHIFQSLAVETRTAAAAVALEAASALL